MEIFLEQNWSDIGVILFLYTFPPPSYCMKNIAKLNTIFIIFSALQTQLLNVLKIIPHSNAYTQQNSVLKHRGYFNY